MIGLIFHFGLYSVPAYDDPASARRRKTQNGSEWYKARLEEDGKWRPIAGYQSTQLFHQQNYPNLKYEDFKEHFANQEISFETWMKLAVSVGATYVILTARHHDGYCLWETKTTDFNSTSTGPKRDLIKEFKEAALKYNLRFGIYYSLLEFGKSITIKYFNEVIVPQLKELQNYSPDILWFDGHWELKSKYSKTALSELIQIFKKQNLKLEVNDRIGDEKDADFRVFCDRYIPPSDPGVRWEHINTIGLSWGRNKMQTEKDYKSGRELKMLYDKVKELKGNFLLNLGPDADGTLDPFEVKSMEEFAKLRDE